MMTEMVETAACVIILSGVYWYIEELFMKIAIVRYELFFFCRIQTNLRRLETLLPMPVLVFLFFLSPTVLLTHLMK